MGESDRENVPDRVEPVCRLERFKLIDWIMAAGINPAPATSSTHTRNIFISSTTFLEIWQAL